MERVELLIGLLVVVAALVRLAEPFGVPYPVLLVIGGLVIAAIPGLPKPELDPEVVFIVFLPPLLFTAAQSISPRELQASARPLTLLAVGLVLVGVAAVAAVARWMVPDLPWPSAFVLGAILGPTDPIAAVAVLRRLGGPHRLTFLLEAESLVNDGTGLAVYKVAVAATVTGAFSLAGAAGQLVLVALGGVAVGLVVGGLSELARRRLDDPSVELTISVLTPFAAYLAAEEVGVSGILAVVTAGVWLGWRAPLFSSPRVRLRTRSFWESVGFLLESLLFVLLGLEVTHVLTALDAYSVGDLAGFAAAVVGTLILLRLASMLVVPALARLVPPPAGTRGRRPMPPRERLVLAWGGMRGALSLAAALALPLEDATGAPFPERDLLVFLAFVAVIVTLVGQGLTLSPLIRRLDVGAEEEEGERAEAAARVAAAHAALARLEEQAEGGQVPERVVAQLRERYELRIRALAGEDGAGPGAAGAEAYRDLRRDLLDAERETVERLRAEGEISLATMRRLERELDLEASRLGEG